MGTLISFLIVLFTIKGSKIRSGLKNFAFHTGGFQQRAKYTVLNAVEFLKNVTFFTGSLQSGTKRSDLLLKQAGCQFGVSNRGGQFL